VTEHEARLLCALCLRKALVGEGAERRKRRVPAVVLLAGGLVFSWLLYLGVAGGISEFSARMEQAAWQNR
jgi:hypothetical protein